MLMEPLLFWNVVAVMTMWVANLFCCSLFTSLFK